MEMDFKRLFTKDVWLLNLKGLVIVLLKKKNKLYLTREWFLVEEKPILLLIIK
jgi:hypothetical protein